MKKEPTTKVVFRKWPAGKGGGVLALFPEIPAGIRDQYCLSYEHIGKYEVADYNLRIRKIRPAAPEEYADLKEELEKIGYHLDVVKRITPAIVKARRRADALAFIC